MTYFTKLPFHANVEPLRAQIAAHPELWNQNKLRTTHENTAHAQVDDIWLRYNAWDNFDPEHPQDFGAEHETVNYPAWHVLTAAQALTFDIARRMHAVRVGGALITRVPGGAQIAAHIDRGWHVEHYNCKVYVTIEGDAAQLFWAGQGADSEAISPTPGDVYHFDNRFVHGVINDSGNPRMTLILCYRIDA